MAASWHSFRSLGLCSPSGMLSRRPEGLSPGTTGLRITKEKAKTLHSLWP